MVGNSHLWVGNFRLLGGIPLRQAISSAKVVQHRSIRCAYLHGSLGHALAALFSYSNTVIAFNLNGTNLVYGLDGEHDIFYALSAILVSVPVMLATWAEPLTCDLGLVSHGGHILFDFTIPIAMIMYYAVASRLPSRKSNTKVA